MYLHHLRFHPYCCDMLPSPWRGASCPLVAFFCTQSCPRNRVLHILLVCFGCTEIGAHVFLADTFPVVLTKKVIGRLNTFWLGRILLFFVWSF